MSIVRQQLIDAIKTRFEAIRIKDGYLTDAGRNVLDWHLTDVYESMLPCIIIFGQGDTESSDLDIEVLGLWSHWLLVPINIYVMLGPSTGSEIRKVVADIMTAVGTDDTWGNLAQETEFIGADNKRSITIQMEQYEKTIAKATIQMRLLYRTDYWKL